MALTNAQKTDVRRYMGYQVTGDMALSDTQDVVFARFAGGVITLHYRLTTLSATEESVLINTFLTNLATLETAIVSTSANLDTEKAAVWTHNQRERQDREALFNSWRRKMCAFLGFEPGPDLAGANSIPVSRA